MRPAGPAGARWLPALVAAFLVVAWLVPIDSITPRGFSAFDLKLDRVMLALLGLAWLGSLLAGGPAAPRLRGGGPVAVMVVAFGVVALFSVLIDLHVLLMAGDSDLGTKKLLLLGSYLAFFLIVATSLTGQDVVRLGRLFLWLGTLAAAGIVYDRITRVNPFFFVARQVFGGGGFSIRPLDTSPIDPHPVTGPSRHALGAAGMLAMAVPFALLGMLESRGRRRLLHVAAFALLMTGVWATNRKTGVFASVAALGFLTLVQPRAMLVRVLPFVALALLVLAAVRPHGVSYELERLSPARITKGASSQGRSADYPAIVPDVRAHLLLGRGWGTYDHAKYRVLDNNYLLLLIETGVVGTGLFAAIILATWMCAHRAGRLLGSPRAGPALASAAGAMAFAVSMALFDATAFPQVPYFFFLLAGFVAALWREAQAERAPRTAATGGRVAGVPRGTRPQTA